MSAWVWIIAGLILLSLEAAHGGFILSMLGLGSLLAAAAAAMTGGSLLVALSAFVIFSAILLVFLRPFALEHIQRWPATSATNVQALMGQSARVVKPFAEADRVGYILVGNEQWRAHLAEGWSVDQVPEGSTCTVLAAEGATLEVCPEALMSAEHQ